METDSAAPPRSRTRRYLSFALLVALAVLAGRLIEDYRYEHRDEYEQFAVPWSHFTTSPDGRTLSFEGRIGLICWEPDRVELKRGEPIVATVYYEVQAVRDGQSMFCTLDEPLPNGTLIVDGFDPSEPNGRGSNRGCPRSEQRVGDAPPTTSPFDLPCF